jgi:fucose permease
VDLKAPHKILTKQSINYYLLLLATLFMSSNEFIYFITVVGLGIVNMYRTINITAIAVIKKVVVAPN